MIDRQLTNLVPGSKKYIFGVVVTQWFALLANVVLIFAIAFILNGIWSEHMLQAQILYAIGICILVLAIRFLCSKIATHMSHMATVEVKTVLRGKAYEKLLRLGAFYHQEVSTSEVVQVMAEGVEQLETYFGQYLPQLFYSLIAPITLFVLLFPISWKPALVLLLCVPLIPIAIGGVQTIAKKLLSKYWTSYTNLGDTFLENLQGLTTLKIYNVDDKKQTQMEEESENFRKATMKVLIMQLNSTTIMDLIVYGGSALGIIFVIREFLAGAVGFAGALVVILLSAEFFIPMRQLGSFFHVAMNGMSASKKIFHLLSLEEQEIGTEKLEEKEFNISLQDVSFSYDKQRNTLENITFTIPPRSIVALVGESGCGKSTVVALLSGKYKNYTGHIQVGEKEVINIVEEDLQREITTIKHDSYLFAGTIRDHLLIGNDQATDERMWEILEQVQLAEFLKTENGLETVLKERGSNLSGGQRQRLAIARGLLHDSAVYLLDEATSNIDAESEETIMQVVNQLADTKSVLLVSHRLANVVNADNICVLDKGKLIEQGTHEELLKNHSVYANLFLKQQSLENIVSKEQV